MQQRTYSTDSWACNQDRQVRHHIAGQTIVVRSPRENWPVLIGGTTVSSTCGIMGSQEIISKHGSTGSVETGDTQNFDTYIDESLDKNGNSTPIFSKAIGRELFHNSSSDIYLRCRVEFTSNVVGTEAPDFMLLGLPAVNTSNEVMSFGTPNTRVGRTTNGSNWSGPVHMFGELTAV